MTTMQDALTNAAVGMARVETKAGEEWNVAADMHLLAYAKTHSRFLAEDIVEAASGLEVHDRRAWGPVVARAKKACIIVRDGYAPARTSNATPKTVWLSLVTHS